jgi:sigma-B regulation protein RsbU (phosphoserine phosphatase)
MKSAANARLPLRIVRQQARYLAIAAGVYAVFWAATGQAPTLSVTLIYSFLLGNFTTLALEQISIPGVTRESSWYWPLNLVLLLAVTAIAVTLATLVVFLVSGTPGGFQQFLSTGWKFPAVANLIFGMSFFIHQVTRWRLEDRNRQLERTLELRTAERELDAEELKQAREIQQGLLPKDLPQLSEFEIAGAWEPACLVGGDYYDVIKLGKDKLAICIADVVGKGISAALLMANVQAAVRAFATEAATPSYVCSRINSVLCANIATGKFVTLFYGVLDASSRILQYTNAGHLRPILIGDDGNVKHLENGGALLGVFPDWKYEDSTVELDEGDLLMAFTDGITEAMDAEGEEFGEERLIQVARNTGEQSMEDLKTQLLGSVQEFCNFRMRDDATLILIAASRVGSEQRKPALISFQNEATELARSKTVIDFSTTRDCRAYTPVATLASISCSTLLPAEIAHL